MIKFVNNVQLQSFDVKSVLHHVVMKNVLKFYARNVYKIVIYAKMIIVVLVNVNTRDYVYRDILVFH